MYPLLVLDFITKWTYFDRYWKSLQILNIVTISVVEADWFVADRRTDRHEEANCVFSNFERAPKPM
jgi:hypothetical protein